MVGEDEVGEFMGEENGKSVGLFRGRRRVLMIVVGMKD